MTSVDINAERIQLFEELAAQIQPCDISRPYIFISYSRNDFERVYPCVIGLQKQGFNIWIDKEMRDNSDRSWINPALEAIERFNCVTVIFMMSENSLVNAPCFCELFHSQHGVVTNNIHGRPIRLIAVNAAADLNADSPIKDRAASFAHMHHGIPIENIDKSLIIAFSKRNWADSLPDEILDVGDIATAIINKIYSDSNELYNSTAISITDIDSIAKSIINAEQVLPAPRNVSKLLKAVLAVSVITAMLCFLAYNIPHNVSKRKYSFYTVSGKEYCGEYTGGWRSGKPNGIGTLAYSNNGDLIVYEGEWKNGIRSGEGRMIFANGDIYEGEWASDAPNGSGSCTWAEGDIRTYIGEFKNGFLNGQGKAVYANGNIYEGQWRNSLRSGIGTFTFVSGDYKGNVYEGEWAFDKYNGSGRYTWACGNVYEGEFKNGTQNGQGKMAYTGGDVYEGTFKDGLPNGQGILTYSDGEVYEGEFKNGLPNGQGIFTYFDGDTYEGEWKDGRKNGMGLYTFGPGEDEGTVDEGEWKDGKKHGYGKEVFNTGEVYEGYWAYGQRNGQGRITYSNGDVYDGEWKDGEKDGIGTYTFSNGTVWKGRWRKGKFIG